MGWIILCIGIALGFIAGILFGRRNRTKVEDVIAVINKLERRG